VRLSQMPAVSKHSDADVQRLWRVVLGLLTQRSGLDLHYVLSLQPFVGHQRNVLMNQANGCRHLAIYLLRTLFEVHYRQLELVSGLSRKRVQQVVSFMAESRGEGEYFETWISDIERLVNTVQETGLAA
jgi:hypothetical protein